MIQLREMSRGSGGVEKKWPWQDLECDPGSEQPGTSQTAPAAAALSWVFSTAHAVESWRRGPAGLYACSG